MPEMPFCIDSLKLSISLPIGLITPNPVITTRLLIL